MLRVLCVLLFVFLVSSSWAAPPNVLLVMTDDQGYGDLSCHGNDILNTPHLDRLYGQSARLTNYHVDPTCSPTRSALLTGRYSTRTGVWHTIAGRSLMRPEEVTMADVFGASGYRTACFGKWHLGDTRGLLPWQRGFDVTLTHGGGGVTQTPDYWGNDYFDDTYVGSPGFFPNAPEPTRPHAQMFDGYCTDVWFDQAWTFIEATESAGDQPWFCYLATNAPHSPFIPPEGTRDEELLAAGLPEKTANFYAMIENIDDNMGTFLKRLDDAGLADDTIVVFTSDNGSAAGAAMKRTNDSNHEVVHGFNAGMRGLKGSYYEGGHRVPCFWRWPGGEIGGGEDIDTLTAHIDVLPTLVELCGLTPGEHPTWDGVSLADVLRGEEPTEPVADRTVVVHSQRVADPIKGRKFAVMTPQYRYTSGGELYDIVADPGQRTNIAVDHADVVGQLQHEYDQWWASLTPSFDTLVRLEIEPSRGVPTHLTCHDWHPTGEGRWAVSVPWNHETIQSDPVVTGWFAVRVVEAGTYRVRGRMRPIEADPYALPAGMATFQLGDVQATANVAEDASFAEVTVDLPAGEHRMEFTLNSGPTTCGFYYVELERL